VSGERDDNSLYGVPMSLLSKDDSPVLSKRALKQYQVPHTRACTALAIGSPDAGAFNVTNLLIGAGKTARLLRFSPENPGGAPDMGEGGSYTEEHELACASIIDSVAISGGVDGLPPSACLALRSGEFLLWNLRTGASSPVLAPPAAFIASATVTAAPNQPGESAEFVLTVNQMSTFRTAEGAPARPFDVRWNAVPQTVAYAPPYVMAFSRDTIEVATLINGKLVKTLSFLGLRCFSAQDGIFFGSQLPTGVTSLFTFAQDRVGDGDGADVALRALDTVAVAPNQFSRKLSRVYTS
jgi:hypothetical protein